jgi:hypothetical protein
MPPPILRSDRCVALLMLIDETPETNVWSSVDFHSDAAVLSEYYRIGANVGAVAAQITACPKIKRTIVKGTKDGRSADKAIGERSLSVRAIGLGREHFSSMGMVYGDV